MNSYLLLLLLGYLYFCIAVNPIESSDWTKFSKISDKYSSFNNCMQCDEQQELSCSCMDFFEKCIVCYSGNSCCICPTCAPCWYEQRQLIIMTGVVISILFAFGIVGLIIVYCKICNKTREHTQTHRRRIILHEARDLMHCTTIEGLPSRERPPSYNEVVRTQSVYTSSCNAPPLYTSPYNRASMQEAPPSYPGTPKPQEKLRDSNEPPFSLPIAQHM